MQEITAPERSSELRLRQLGWSQAAPLCFHWFWFLGRFKIHSVGCLFLAEVSRATSW